VIIKAYEQQEQNPVNQKVIQLQKCESRSVNNSWNIYS